MSPWFTLLAIGAGTFVLRAAFLVKASPATLSPTVRASLRFVPVAVLTALITPALVRPAGTLDISLGNARLVAGILAAAVAWRTRNAVVTVGAGLVALWILQAAWP